MSLITKLRETDHIYFVCSGNIIRSAFAELLAKKYEINNCSSFGTRYRNHRIHHKSAEALQKRGVSNEEIESFHPTFLDDVDEFIPKSVYFVMTNGHKEDLTGFGLPPDDIYLLDELNDTKDEIEDPYFTGTYNSVFERIERSIIQIHTILTGNF